jgi:saccharopine dehydrogenase-like NADP-dependent oxidoreductase
MKVILFGATGMVGQGVLRECLVDPGVESVLVVGRSPTGQQHAKLREILHDDFMDFRASSPSSPDTTPASSASAFPRSAWTKRATGT